MIDRTPLVSIGFPVRNGEKYLVGALETLLAQTCQDFELIISDNASTDSTEEICRSYAAKDDRIRYSRNETNVGVGRNHNLVFLSSTGRYFMWAAHDDLYAPDYISKCVAVLESDASIALCNSLIARIDASGRCVRTFGIDKGRSPHAHDRFRSLILMDHSCEQMYGLIRSSVLRRTGLHQNYTDSDRTLLSEIALYGPFYEIPEPLFFHRVHPESSVSVYPDWRARMLAFEPNLKGQKVFPHWLQCAHYFRSIRHSPLGWYERGLCYVRMGGWLLRYGRGLVKDLLVAIMASVKRSPALPDNIQKSYSS
jgi:glycosyltransferase involved in cell wall biosynthesis